MNEWELEAKCLWPTLVPTRDGTLLLGRILSEVSRIHNATGRRPTAAFIHPRVLLACGLPRRFEVHGLKVRECAELRDEDIALTVTE